jgi:NAD(P)-dependent dehydrogenase (short-subunit alcohol dehydrogenase family)
MGIDFTGEIVLVTGGGNSIGTASARKFAAVVARVAVIELRTAGVPPALLGRPFVSKKCRLQ